MDFRWHLLFPLFSSLLYVAGALLVKRANEFGVGVWRTSFVANVTSAIFFLPLLLLGGDKDPSAAWWQPALVALLFLIGQILTLLAVTRGDVSIATPVMGVKIILVAIFLSGFFSETVPLKLWISAILSTLAIVLLHFGGGSRHGRIGLTIVLAATGAASFALFDVLVQKWSPLWGAGRFLPIMIGLVVIYSGVMVPFFRQPIRAIRPRAWPWLLGGSAFIAAQGVVLIGALAIYGDATAVNIVYSSRGLWSVLAVWWIGHWFHNQEQFLGARVLGWRFAGATMMVTAIALVMA